MSTTSAPVHRQHEMYSAPGSLDNWPKAGKDGGLPLTHVSAQGIQEMATLGPWMTVGQLQLLGHGCFQCMGPFLSIRGSYRVVPQCSLGKGILCVTLQAVILSNHMSTCSVCVLWSLETQVSPILNGQLSLSVQHSGWGSGLIDSPWTPRTPTPIHHDLLLSSTKALNQLIL